VARRILLEVVGWGLIATAIGAGLVIWTIARGGELHRTLICGSRDANFYALGIQAGLAALIPLLLYWALGATSSRWRWVRLAGVAIAALPISLGIFVGGSMFTVGCTYQAPV
jgi:hypothetical protein